MYESDVGSRKVPRLCEKGCKPVDLFPAYVLYSFPENPADDAGKTPALKGAAMAEDDTPNREEDADKTPTVVTPSHDPLPPPPEISFTRPSLGRATPSPTKRAEQTRAATGGGSGPAPFNLGVGMSAGITLASSVVVGFLIGQWIDHHWHLSMPWGTIVFSLAGVTAGFLNLFRILSVSDDKSKK